MYDFFLESVYLLTKNGLSISFLGAFIYYFLKLKRTRKRIQMYVPWLFGDDSEVKEYVHNQKVIMSKQEALLINQKNIAERLGLPWIAPISPIVIETLTKKEKKSTRLYSIMKSIAQNVKKYTRFGGKKMKKFKSRKFIMALVTGLLIVLNDGLDLGIDSNTVLTFSGVVVTWILGESFVDGKRNTVETPKGEEYHR